MISLDEKETEMLLSIANKSCIVDISDHQWQRVKNVRSRGIEVHRSLRNGYKNIYSMYSQVTFLATLDRTIRLLKGHEKKFNTAFRRDLVDISAEAVVSETTNELVTVKRATMVNAKLAREVIYLECQEEITMDEKRRGYVCAMHSIDMPQYWPPVEGITRANILHSGIAVCETGIPGVLQAVYALHVDFKEAASPILCERLITQRLLSLQQLAHHATPPPIRWLKSMLAI